MIEFAEVDGPFMVVKEMEPTLTYYKVIDKRTLGVRAVRASRMRARQTAHYLNQKEKGEE